MTSHSPACHTWSRYGHRETKNALAQLQALSSGLERFRLYRHGLCWQNEAGTDFNRSTVNGLQSRGWIERLEDDGLGRWFGVDADAVEFAGKVPIRPAPHTPSTDPRPS